MERSPENKELRLDNRHLLLFFLGAVLICASFFSLGFWLGRGQAGEAPLAVGDGLQPDLQASGASAGEVNPPAATGGIRATPPDQPAGPASAKPDPANPPDFRKELDFYSAVKDQSVDENFRPRSSEEKNRKAARQPSKARRAPSRSPSGSGSLLHLQVAALRNRADANRLAAELRGKGYPVVVVAPSKSETPAWIRVKVGPFRSARKTSQVKARLARDGYESIMRRQ